MTGRRAETASVLLVALAVAQLFHGLDSLRTDDEATLANVLLAPQSLAGIGGSILAAVALRRGWDNGRLLATLSGGLVALGFLVVHGLPWKSERIEPYWGDGSADAVQWLGVLVIWGLCAWILTLVYAPAEPEVAPAAPARRDRPLVAEGHRPPS